MRIKSFYASTVEAAVALARRELGPDAMLVQSRKAPVEARHLGEYEVVCALVPENGPEQKTVPPGAEAAPPESRLAYELAELRKQMEVMGKTIRRSAWNGQRWSAASPGVAEVHTRLMAADLDGELVNEILDAVCRRLAESPGSPDAAVATELETRISVDATLAARAGDGPRVAALVGPPGAGKTTMLVKLAVQYGVTARRPMALFSMDDYRVGGAEQLKSYAAILGAGFEALDTVGALAQAIEEHHAKGLILVDTPGYGPRDMDRGADLARYLAAQPEITTHLVLTAGLKSADLLHVADRFEVFRPASLMFTRLDETESFGTAFSVAARVGRPISFLSTGQEIPDDLLPATREKIMTLLWPETACRVLSAA